MLQAFFKRATSVLIDAWARLTGNSVRGKGQPGTDSVTRLDHKVLARLRAGRLPNFGQLKYVSHFFSKTEKLVVLIAGVVGAVASLGLLLVFLIHHLAVGPAQGGSYSEAMIGQPKYLNPLFSSASDIDSDISSLIYNGLFSYNAQGQLVPDLAASYTLSDDKKTYTVSLKHGVMWSDGEPFTANDVFFTWEMIQNPEVGSPLYPTFQPVTVEKIDDFTVRFILKQPYALFLDSLTNGILPEHVWGDIAPENVKLAKTNIQPVGTGPWMFQKLVKDGTGFIQNYSLLRNDNFFGSKPYLKTLEFRFFTDYASAIDAVRGQTVDALSFVPREARNKLSTKNVVNYDIHLPQYTALFFNLESPILKTLEARNALAGVIDKEDLIKTAIAGEGFAVDGPVLPGQIGYTENLPRYKQTPENATESLDKLWSRMEPGEYFNQQKAALIKSLADNAAAASSTTSTADSNPSAPAPTEAEIDALVRQNMDASQRYYRHTKSGDIIDLKLVTVDTPEYHAVADYVVAAWRNLGIKVSVQFVSARQLTREVLRQHTYDVLLYGEIVGNDTDLYPFWDSSQIAYPGLNLSRWSNDKGDKLLEEARITYDVDKRADLFEQFQKILIADQPAVFLYSPNHVFAVNKRIRGIALTGAATPESRYRGLAGWYVKTHWMWK